MFRGHFLGNFLAELNEICWGSLLNSILKTHTRKFLKTFMNIFYAVKFCVFFTKKMIDVCSAVAQWKNAGLAIERARVRIPFDTV